MRRNEWSLRVPRVLLAWVPCMPNRHKPNRKTKETLENRYEETKARFKKIENADYKVASIWGVSLKNC